MALPLDSIYFDLYWSHRIWLSTRIRNAQCIFPRYNKIAHLHHANLDVPFPRLMVAK